MENSKESEMIRFAHGELQYNYSKYNLEANVLLINKPVPAGCDVHACHLNAPEAETEGLQKV